MRYFVGFVLFLLALAASPMSVSAQADEEGATVEPAAPQPGRPDLSGERYQPWGVPRGVGAQADEEGATVEPGPREPSLPSEPGGEEGSRSLEYADPVSAPSNTKWGLDWSLVGETPDVQTAKIGLGVSTAVLAVGGVVLGISFIELCILQEDCPEPSWHRPVRITGGVLMAGGAAGMIVSGILLGVRKRKLRRLPETHYGRPRRVQWDLAGSRLVF